MMVGIFQKIGSKLHDQSDHVIEHLCLLVHVDGQIGLTSGQVHLFCLLVVAFSFKLLGLLDLDCSVLTLRKVVDDKLVGFLPLVGTHIHFKSFNVFASLDKELLSLIILSDFSVMTSNLDLVGSDLISRLVLDEVDCSVPVAGLQGRFNGFIEDCGLNKVIDGLI